MNINDRPRAIFRGKSGKLVVGNCQAIFFSDRGKYTYVWDRHEGNQLCFGHDEIGYNLFLDNFVMKIKNHRGYEDRLYENDIVRIHRNIEGTVPNEKDYTDHLVIWLGDCSSNPCFDLLPHPDGIDYNGIEWMIDSVDVRGVEIIGNKHQNRELVPEAALKALETK